MLKYLKILILISILIPAVIYTQDFKRVHELIVRGQENVFNINFEAALTDFREASNIAPNDLRGPFFESSVYFWKSMLTKNKDDYKTYMTLSDRIVDKCEEILDKNENDLDARFYLGWTYSLRGVIVYFIDKDVFKAGYDLKDANKQLNYIVEKNRSYYDAYMGLGLYNYAMSLIPRKYQLLTSLLGFEGDKETGKKQLMTAADNGIYTGNESKLYMSFLSWREENYPAAEDYVKQVMNKYPNSPGVMMIWGLLLSQQDKLNESIQAFEKAIELNKGKESDIVLKNSYGSLGTSYFRLNNFEKAIEYSTKYINYLSNDDRKNNRIYSLGVSLELSGRRNEALNFYNKVRTNIDEDNDWERYWMRKVNERASAPLTPPESLLVLADNNRSAGNLTEAEKEFEILKNNYFNNVNTDLKVQITHGLGSLYFKKKDYNKAIEYFKQNLNMNPEREKWLIPEAYFQIGRSYLRLGNKAEAAKYFDIAEDIDYNYDFKDAMDTKIKNELSKF